MKTSPFILFTALVALLFSACGADSFSRMSSADAISHIEEQEQVLFDAMGQHTDSVSRSILELYGRFVEKFPEHELSPEYLSRSGNIARSLKDYPTAIAQYQKILDNYPNYDKVTEAHFLIAFIYDNDIEDKEKAKSVYQTIADTRGDHIFAKQAKERLETIHLSDKELIDRFRKQNADKAAQAAEQAAAAN